MRNVEIQVRLIAQTRPNRTQIEDWLCELGASTSAIDRLNYDNDIPQGEHLVQVAARRCYLSFEAGLNPNVTRVREDLAAYFDNVLKSGHGSVLEHASYSFAIEGITRVGTAELNRHRAGAAISEGSMRYIRFQDDPGIPWWMPYSLRPQQGDDENLLRKKETTREMFAYVFRTVEVSYQALVALWELDKEGTEFAYKKQITSCLRRIIPMGVSTGGVWTFNLRALRHMIALRCHPAAEEEIALVVGKMAAIIAKEEPHIFGDFTETPQGFWVPKYHKV